MQRRRWSSILVVCVIFLSGCSQRTKVGKAAHKVAGSKDKIQFKERFRRDPGLYCEAVPETNIVEQGMPLNISIGLVARPAELPPRVKHLNTFWMREFFRLHLRNRENRETFSLDLEEFYSAGFLKDDLSKVEPLDGRRMGPWKMTFRLVRLRDELVPGRYSGAVEFAYPKDPHKFWRIHPNRKRTRAWEEFGFWSGRIISAPFELEIREEQPKQMEFTVPKAPHLERTDDGTYQLVFRKGEVEKVLRDVHNGFTLGERIENPDDTGSEGSGLSEWGREERILKIPRGKNYVRFRATAFKTTQVPDHFWSPQGGNGYNVLWEARFETNLADNVSISE